MISCLNSPISSLSSYTLRTGPAAHFDYYARCDRRNELSWLVDGPVSASQNEPECSPDVLFAELDVVCVVLASHTDGVEVCRVLSPLLIPLTFGEKMELTSHQLARISLPVDSSSKLSGLHFFA
jgi:hypothetical protein